MRARASFLGIVEDFFVNTVYVCVCVCVCDLEGNVNRQIPVNLRISVNSRMT